MDPVPCFAEWMATGPYATYVTERRFAAGAPAKLLMVRQPAGDYPDPPSRDFNVQYVMGGSYRARLDLGAGRIDAANAPGTLVVAPHGTPCSYAIEGEHTVLVACLPWETASALVRTASDGLLTDLGPLHHATHRDQRVQDLLTLLWRQADDEAPASRLYADGLSQALVAAIVRLALPGRPPARATALPAWRLRRAQAILGDRLDEEIALADVAAAVGLSPFHFARGFKAATGMPPHGWRNARRIAHAQALLTGTPRPIAEIAAACGFCSQAHLTNAFRKVTGTTPGAWRKLRQA